MNASKFGIPRYVAAYPGRTTVCVLYAASLVYVFSTISFSEERTVRDYIAQTMNRPAAALPPLPVLPEMAWPDMTLRRDPFQPLATSMDKAGPNPNHSPPPTSRRLRGLTDASDGINPAHAIPVAPV